MHHQSTSMFRKIGTVGVVGKSYVGGNAVGAKWSTKYVASSRSVGWCLVFSFCVGVSRHGRRLMLSAETSVFEES